MLTKYVKSSGGDYNNITTAFNDMLVSGAAATGTITEYLMIVDGGTYSGTFSGTIPYSGNFNIIGSGTSLYLTTHLNKLGGTYSSSNTPNLYIDDFTIYSSGVGDVIYVPSGFCLGLKNIQFINNLSGIYNAGGTVYLDNVSSCGVSGTSQYFLYNISGGMDVITNSTISNYKIGLYSKNLFASYSNVHTNNTGIYYPNTYNVAVDHCLVHNIYDDIVMRSGYLYINDNTFGNKVSVSGAWIYGEGNIFSTIGNISGTVQAGSYLNTSCMPVGDILNANISGTNNFYADPKFNDVSVGDYRLKFKQTEGSPCVEVKPNINYDDSITFYVSVNSLYVSDKFGTLDNFEFLPYTYTQDSSIILSDYNKEIKFANLKEQFKTLNYKLKVNIQFDEYNVLTYPSFDINVNNIDNYPWDWDYKEISTTEITDQNKYIVPRTIVNVENIISNKISVNPTQVFYNEIVKDNITFYKIEDLKGISYDKSMSIQGQSIIWVLDGFNQSLIKKNAFTNEDYETYPLLCPYASKSLIKPSGLIYTGVQGDYYTFIKQNDPNVELIGLSELGDFKWVVTNLNPLMDLRGVLVFKDNIFITAGQYPFDITDRTKVTIGEPIGKLLWYNSNDLFFNYTKPLDQVNNATLSSGNIYPTDLTMYEDGTLFIADYLSQSGIYKYKLAFDYALVNSTYDNETKVILREFYNNVDL